jgi:hypothetical protein
MNFQRGKGYLCLLAVLLVGCVVTPSPPYYSDEQARLAPPGSSLGAPPPGETGALLANAPRALGTGLNR